MVVSPLAGCTPCIRHNRSRCPTLMAFDKNILRNCVIDCRVLSCAQRLRPVAHGRFRGDRDGGPERQPRSESRWTTLQSPRMNAIVPSSCAPRSVIGIISEVRRSLWSGRAEAVTAIALAQAPDPLVQGEIGLPWGQWDGRQASGRARTGTSEIVCLHPARSSCDLCPVDVEHIGEENFKEPVTAFDGLCNLFPHRSRLAPL